MERPGRYSSQSGRECVNAEITEIIVYLVVNRTLLAESRKRELTSMNFECICVQVSNTISNTKSTQIILPHEEDPAERAAMISCRLNHHSTKINRDIFNVYSHKDRNEAL